MKRQPKPAKPVAQLPTTGELEIGVAADLSGVLLAFSIEAGSCIISADGAREIAQSLLDNADRLEAIRTERGYHEPAAFQ